MVAQNLTNPKGAEEQKEKQSTWEALLNELLDRSGMWSRGNGGSSGPKPQLTELELPEDDEASQEN